MRWGKVDDYGVVINLDAPMLVDCAASGLRARFPLGVALRHALLACLEDGVIMMVSGLLLFRSQMTAGGRGSNHALLMLDARVGDRQSRIRAGTRLGRGRCQVEIAMAGLSRDSVNTTVLFFCISLCRY